MSRVKSIDDLQVLAYQAKKSLGDEIHRVFHPGRKVLFQVGYSEDRKDWKRCEVVGPYNATKIIIRDAEHAHIGKPGFLNATVEGIDMRLDLDGSEEGNK